jgi:hypothetical protein
LFSKKSSKNSLHLTPLDSTVLLKMCRLFVFYFWENSSRFPKCTKWNYRNRFKRNRYLLLYKFFYLESLLWHLEQNFKKFERTILSRKHFSSCQAVALDSVVFDKI